MIAVLVLTQLADVLTARSAIEANPIAAVLLASGFAIPAKLALCALLASVSAILGRRWPMVAGVVAGIIGLASNVVAW